MAQVGMAVQHGRISVSSTDHRNNSQIRSSCSYDLPRACCRTNFKLLNLYGLEFHGKESISLRLTCNCTQMRIGGLLYKRHFYPVCCGLGVRKRPSVSVFPRRSSREKTHKKLCPQGSGVLKETDHIVKASAITTGDDPFTEDGRTTSLVENRTAKTQSGELAIPTICSDSLIREGKISNAHDSTHELEIVDDGRRTEIELKWYQSRLVNFVRPIVRVLNGAAFSRSKGIVSGYKDIPAIRFLSTIPKILSGAAPSSDSKGIMGERLRQAEADFFTFTGHLGKYLFIMMATGAILATGYQLAGGNSQQETLLWSSWLAGIIIGSMIGAGKVMERRGRAGPRNIIITGSTRGLGKALAREFLLAGDRVVVASRSLDSVVATVAELQNELDRKNHCSSMVDVGNEDLRTCRTENYRPKVVGMTCDVSNVEDVRALAEFAVQEFGSIDIWINNAGVNKGFRPLVQFSDDDIRQIVSANLIGSLICTRQAIQVMKSQPKRGHVFNMDGAGSGGSSTPLTAVYGSTKCGLRQLHASLLKEYKRSGVGIHTASPGMVLTDLLLSGASLQNKKMFNIICELPETVARALVPRMRDVKGTGKSINYLTPPRILLALVTAWLRRGRWFDEEGRAVYAAETDRIRNWAEGRTRLPVSAAIDQFSDTTWVSVFSLCVICAFIMLSNSTDSMPGT